VRALIIGRAEEALRQAEAEGVTLERPTINRNSATGESSQLKPF
jgi:hypothetical protein